MNKPKSIKIAIPKPCVANYDEMSATQAGRFCNSCQKEVVDFTNMTDDEIFRFFTKQKGNVCGSIHPERLNTSFKFRKASHFKLPGKIAAAFLFMQASMAQVFAQIKSENPVTTVSESNFTNEVKFPFTLRGIVRDHSSGKPLPNIIVSIKWKNISAVTNEKGRG